MNTRYYITIISLIIFTYFSYGQVQLEPVCAESDEKYYVGDGLPGSRFIWQFDHSFGQIVEGEGTDTIIIRWGYGTGNVDLQVTEYTDQGCFDVPSEAELEIRAPYVDLGYDFPEICREDSLVLSPGGVYGSTALIEWHNGSTDYDFTAKETEQIWVHVIDENGCSRYDTVSLLVHELPQVFLGNDTILCDLTSPLLLDPGNFADYEWTFSSSEDGSVDRSSYLYIEPTSMEPDTLSVLVTDYNECQTSDTIVFFPCDLQGLFKEMPNTLTPDGDGFNDTWNIPYMEFFDEAVLEVFDRWGRLVYRATNVDEEPWNGTSKGRDLPMDAYYFVLNLNVFNAEPIVGTVNLIR